MLRRSVKGKEKRNTEENAIPEDMWKEMVRIDAIQLPKHIYRWDSSGFTKLIKM